jgi:hypothetical protein
MAVALADPAAASTAHPSAARIAAAPALPFSFTIAVTPSSCASRRHLHAHRAPVIIDSARRKSERE